MAKQITPQDRDSEQQWVRELPDEEHDTRGVTATRSRAGVWTVNVQAMEFIRNIPLEHELRTRILAALHGVAGVTEAGEEDREIWTVEGTPHGDALVDAVGAVLDALATQTRAAL